MRPIADRRLVPEPAGVVEGQAEIGTRNLRGGPRHQAAQTSRPRHQGVIVKHQVAGRPLGLLGMARGTTPFKDRFDIPIILDILDTLFKAQTGLGVRSLVCSLTSRFSAVFPSS